MTAVRFNALLRAFLFSTMELSASTLGKMIVSMPYFGLFSFLLLSLWMISPVCRRRFNALLRAFLFSTRRYENMKYYDVAMFQCPTSGFSLFYLTKSVPTVYASILFQCPTSGFSLFYTMALQPLILLALQIHFCV